jgi:hypothetical protein
LEDKDPERFKEALLSVGIEPSEYDDWRKGGYKPISGAVPPDENGTAKPPASGGTAKPSETQIGRFKVKVH